jgi:hypothetical protein
VVLCKDGENGGGLVNLAKHCEFNGLLGGIENDFGDWAPKSGESEEVATESGHLC